MTGKQLPAVLEAAFKCYHNLCFRSRGTRGKGCHGCMLLLLILSAVVEFEFTCNAQLPVSESHQKTSYFTCFADSLQGIKQKLKGDPRNLSLWINASSLSVHLGEWCIPIDRAKHYSDALHFAEKAIALNARSKEARLQGIIARGLLATVTVESREKLGLARRLRQEIDFLLSLDSLYAPAHFALGKWHLSLSKLSWVQQMACKLAGGLPEPPSLEQALRCFDQSIQLQPNNILFHYNKALALVEMGRATQALPVILTAMELPILGLDDEIRMENCRALLIELRSKSI